MKTCLTVAGCPRIILTICCLAASPGCSDPEADYRARICKEAGVPEVSMNACKLSLDEFNRIMEPIRLRQEQELIALFNTAVSNLPTRKIPKDHYGDVSFMQLSSDVDQLHQLEESKWPQHPLFGKHVRIKAWINFSPIDLEERRLFESTRLWIEDSAPVEADTESLSREERAFIKNQCLYLFETCHGEIYGKIGKIIEGPLTLMGLQIEYIDIRLREKKKTTYSFGHTGKGT